MSIKVIKNIHLIFLLTAIIISCNACYYNNNDKGIQRKLPPLEKNKNVEVNKRNIMNILVNSDNEIIINNKKVTIEEINKITKTFFLNSENDKDLPEKNEVELPKIGKTKVSKGIISLQTDRNTGYEIYLQVQNELVSAIIELRDNFAIKHFNNKFDDLTEENRDIVSKAFPLAVSEAEPRRMTNE